MPDEKELPKTHPDHPDNFRKAGEYILGETPIFIPVGDTTPEEYKKKEEVSDVR